MVSATPPNTSKPPGSNKRQLPRKPVVQDAVLVYGEGTHVLDCTLADISPTGARVRLTDVRIPNSVYLIVLKDMRAYSAIVAWRRSNTLGLKFVSLIDLTKLPSANLQFLNRIWIERCMR